MTTNPGGGTAANEAHRETRRERGRRYREANRERIRERGRQRYAANRDKLAEERRQQRAANPGIRERERGYWAANRDKINENARKRRAVNPGIREREREMERLRRAAAPGRAAARARRGNHGLTLDQWLAKRAAQNGLCYLCKRPIPAEPGPGVHVDHDHRCPYHGPKRSCGVCFRGLACRPCNTAIGLLGDDPERITEVGRSLAATRALFAERLLAEPPALFDADELTREATPQ